MSGSGGVEPTGTRLGLASGLRGRLSVDFSRTTREREYAVSNGTGLVIRFNDRD
jgi:hypothetical protein